MAFMDPSTDTFNVEELEQYFKHLTTYSEVSAGKSEGSPAALADKAWQQARSEIDQEEKKFEYVENISMDQKTKIEQKQIGINDMKRKREKDTVDQNKGSGNGMMAAMDQQSLGSAGSSKASSNASDESEEMDSSIGSQGGSGKSAPLSDRTTSVACFREPRRVRSMETSSYTRRGDNLILLELKYILSQFS